ncbi:3-deoxy-D-manno-octulosonic acid transferase [Algoriphagus litoralis]|uniref:3-deoxy-D-manno-octulosonic acid transferase n=1 Tax=Algoriphagus litoralis TaxID=2202829 RepID=UPI000DB9659E|nr:glycosyltransferase N-terminal domain-containing protein [Algoriphagus litoralis]
MNLLYRLIIFLMTGVLNILSHFSGKLRQFLSGRKSLFERLENFKSHNSGPLVWFHVASLGEYEQARPVIAALKASRPKLTVVVSFFSPSGYDHVAKKSQPNVDFFTYLPLDRKSYAARFVGILTPEFVFFVKYDLWLHHIQALKKRGIPVFLISASLREDQPYFGVLGSFFRQNLFAMDWIFTQNEKSLNLLASMGYTDASLAGDTRFDRVAATAAAPSVLPDIASWVGGKPAVVVGSAWDEDMQLLIPLINSRPDYCWIIAPHDLSPEPMDRWASQIRLESRRFSHWKSPEATAVLFIDNIGMLSSLYQFAKVAYVGGAFGKGLHNILEPMGFGVPVLFGKVKKDSKFPEAAQSQIEGCGFSVEDEKALFQQFLKLENPENYQNAVEATKKWVKSNLGAADRIIEKVSQMSLNT